ncbi:hypothetical protein BU25DRAFT_410424 [Macroventuria anomochaeta]|uniref:Uncharacterized protein n=1 Tax=Macroventuria anomochaeta TaxID=301207 RepID=A0ACB6S161_9PLEO|nr:uncharacterized protein BU25DRAFT_410424 [Macroventuria anomochaeta]KAF2627768.1 hypothetical protein BU25DRAFT_410424 [Macroventuria anomochaeta]
MFKAQVLRRSFSVFNRVPSSRIVQSAARDGHESITIHRVRIRRPFLSRQRLVGAVAIATATYGLGQYLGLEVEIEEEDVQDHRKPGRWKKQARKEDGTLEEVDDEEANEDEDGDEEDEDEEEYDDAILFLPTGFSRLKPKTFYKGSDPEWQEFKKVSQDKARIERIRQELVNLVRTACSTPAYVAKIGEVDHKKGRVWIEFKFPDGPPPEYERPGYELTEALEWRKTTRDVEPALHHQLNKVLYPTAAAGALYEDTKRKAERSWNDFAVYMGWAEESEHLTVQQMMQQVGTPSRPTSPAAPPATAASASPFGASWPAATQQPAAQSSSPAAGSAKDLGFALPDPKALTLDLGQFRQDFQKANRGHVHHLPRGAFGVHALIEVYGSKARLTLNVIGVYDPKVGRYVGLHANIWNQAAHRQPPRGGP